MSKIYIVGIVASGKTTLSKHLAKKLNLPCYELDCIVHVKNETGRYKRTPEEQQAEINRIDDEGGWLIEGTYRESCASLLPLADKIIFLDPPLWLRKIRIFTRFVKQNLGIEPCHYHPNFQMLKNMYRWTNDFEKNRPEFEAILKEYQNKLYIISNSAQILNRWQELL